MTALTFEELWDKLRTHDESIEIEAKRAEEFGNSILETVSAFANEPDRGGGYLILGIGLSPEAPFPRYEVVGVPDPDKLQRIESTNTATLSASTAGLSASTTTLSANTAALPARTRSELDMASLPEPLAASLRALGRRAKPDRVRRVIRELCAWQPLGRQELAILLDRVPRYLQRDYPDPMAEAGELQRLQPQSAPYAQVYAAIPGSIGALDE